MANFVVYTYKGDEDLLQECLKALLRVRRNDETIFIMDDEFEPISEAGQEALSSMTGVVYERTYHPRCGNITGPEHAKANAKILYEKALSAGDQTAVKVDSDTLLLDRGWLDKFINDPKKELAGGFHSQVNYMFGLCYAIKAPLVKRIIKDIELNPPWVHCFEDFDISHRVHRWDPSKIQRFALTKPTKSRWVLMPVHEVPPGIRADVLDVNRGSPRNQVLEVMRRTNEAAAKNSKQEEKKNVEGNQKDVVEARCDATP